MCSLLLVLALGGSAEAATLTVGPTGMFPTISAAVSAASSGDRIEVAPGVYPETVNVGVDVDIVGTGGSGATTWSYGGAAGTGLRADGVTLTVEGFTFSGGGRRALRFRQGAVVTLSDVAVTTMGLATSDGGGLYVSSGAVVLGTDVRFDANIGQRGAHAYVNNATFDCASCSFTSASGQDGGALYATSGSVVRLDGPTFSDNLAVDTGIALGGDIAIRTGSLTVTGGTFLRGSADRGGQIRGTDATVRLVGTVLQDGVATDLGGSVAVDGGSLELDGVLISGATATNVGGGVSVNDADLTIVGSELSDNTVTDASGIGGGLHTFGVGATSITDTLVARNSAPAVGGAMRLSDAGTADLLRVTVEDSVSTFGGGVHSDSLLLTITDSVFRNNLGTHGGAVRWAGVGADLRIEGSVFEGNDTTVVGGAVYAHDAAGVVVLDSVFRDNIGLDGAGLYLADLDTTEVRRTTFCANAASDDGGGAYAADVATSEVWTNNTFLENTAADDGGALATGAGPGSLIQFNDFLGNGAADGAVRTFGTGVLFVDNVVMGTTAGDGFDAGTAVPVAQVARNTWFDNTPDDLGGAQGAWGPDNTVTDPLLQLWTANGDCTDDVLWPSLGSPLVDQGDPALLDPDGTRADRGTFGGPEADPEPFADGDGDGWILMFDCDDDAPGTYPGAPDPVDGIDQNCDGLDACDGDGDGWEAAACGGPDCDDTTGAVAPGASETPGDGIDSDCDGADDPRPPAVPMSITLDNPSASRWVGGVLAVRSAAGPLPALLQTGPSPTSGDPYDTYAFGHLSCDPAGSEDDGDASTLLARWPQLTEGVDAWVVGDLDAGTSVTIDFQAQPGDVLSFVAWVDGSPDDIVMLHQASNPLDTSVELFNDLGMPLFFPRFDVGGYDVASSDPSDGTAPDCASSCPALGCFVAPGNGTVGLDAGGVQPWPAVDDLQTWPGFVLDPVNGTLTENGIGSPTVVYREALDDFVMLFETNTGTDPSCPVGTWAIGAATSTDGWNWTVLPDPVIEPTPGTYHTCVTAHPNASVDADGRSLHVWFKAEQDDLACMSATPPWGCSQYTGVGYAHLTEGLVVDVLNPFPALVTNDIFGFPTVTHQSGRWAMVLAKFPQLFVASATSPGGPFTLDPAPVISPGVASWNQQEIFNPALLCDETAPDPLWMMYGGRTRAGTYGPIIEGGVAPSTSGNLVTWLTSLPYLTFLGDLPWRHWDVLQAGSHRLVYFSQKDDQGKNHVGVAATDDRLLRVELAARACP